MKKGRAIALTLGLFVLGSGAVVGFGASAEDNADTYRQLKLFGDVFERVRADYVEEVSDEQLIEAAIRGMLADLDPHSSYMNADEYQDMQEQTRGEFGGLGIQVTMEDGYVKVVAPIDDTPAARAGMKSGDLISHIDGESVLGLTLDQAVDLLRGPVDSEVTITVVRDQGEPFDVTLVRDVIKVESVKWRTEGNVGYIRITQFNEQTTTGLEEAIAGIEEKLGAQLIGYVLDLRNNPGGLLSEAISVSDAFLEQGEIVSTRGRHEEDMQRYNARPGDLAKGLPLVVLINDGSASASEIVAGALKDHQRAILMGTRSFGKGSVQTIVPLPGHGAMRLTTSRYYTPSGVSIQATGITPDIEVELATIEVIKSTERHEEDLRGILTNPDAQKDEEGTAPEEGAQPQGQPEGGTTEPESSTEPTEPAQPEAGTPPAEGDKAAEDKAGGDKAAGDKAAGDQAPGQLGPENDYQLQRALDLLRGYALFSQRSQTQ